MRVRHIWIASFVIAVTVYSFLLYSAERTGIVMVFGDSIAHQLAAGRANAVNAGVPSERMSADLFDASEAEIAGEERMPFMLSAHRPRTVVILQGTNDVTEGVYRGGDAWLDSAERALRSMVQQAQDQNVRVILTTIPPQRAGGRRGRDVYVQPAEALTRRILKVAVDFQLPVVDVWTLVQTDMGTYLSDDDVHLTKAGYDMVWAKIQDRLKEMK